MRLSLVVVGGGITALAAAHRAVELARERGVELDLKVVEARGRLGGTIATERVDGFLVESGPDSFLFHFFDRFSKELRDVTLFHEMLNKRGKPFCLTVGKTIPPSRLDIDSGHATYGLKAYVERVLPAQPDAEFA